MLDVHPPHAPTHTWKDFFIHVGTIVIGLLIAVGLEQTVEWLHHRHQVAETRAALLQERVQNRRLNHKNIQQLLRMQATLQNNLQVLQAIKDHPGMQAASLPGTVFCYSDWDFAETGTWKAAQQSGVLSYMPQDEVRHDEGLYADLTGSADQAGVAVIALNKACQYLRIDPNPTHLSPAQLQETIKQMIAVETEAISWQEWFRDIHTTFPDFEAIPTRQQMSIARPLDAGERAALAKATQLTEQRVNAASPDPDSAAP
jgi:hypothetical protein